IKDARQGKDGLPINKSISHGVTGRETARDRHKVTHQEHASGLLLNLAENIRDGQPLQWVVYHVAASVKGRLKIDATYRRVVDGKLDNLTHFMQVDPALDSRNQDDAQANGCQPVQRAQFLFQNLWLAPDDAIGFAFKAIKLEVNGWSNLSKLIEKLVIIGNALAVGIEHDMPDIACFGGTHHRHNLWVDRWLPTGKLHHFGIAFGLHQMVKDALNLFQRQVKARPGVGKAERAIHIAGAVDLNDAQTGVLLMIGAEAAIVGTAMLNAG